MTKEEAKKQMSMGNKVTHRYFMPYEWATIENGQILLEDGVRCSKYEFWSFRSMEAFDNDWSIWLDIKPIITNTYNDRLMEEVNELLSIVKLIDSKSLDYWTNNWIAWSSLKARISTVVYKLKKS